MINHVSDLRTAYQLRIRRKRLLFRAFRKRRQLTNITINAADIKKTDILAFVTLRNEIHRLPYFLDHHRSLGVTHFFIVDNNSDDGSTDFLKSQSDISLWSTSHSYKLSRFGMDWLTWLMIKFGHGHWCLTLDADEIFIYPHWNTRPLDALTKWLDQTGERSFGAMMLDLYPSGKVGTMPDAYSPFKTLKWFDRGNYTQIRQHKLQNLWIQGGVRARCFFDQEPERAPTMGKIPLVKWDRSYTYVSSTHSPLPRNLNHVYDMQGGEKTSGILLHTKFLPSIVKKSEEEKQRQEHFANSALYDQYYDALTENPDLWCAYSTRLYGWKQLEALGLMSKGGWA